MGEMPSYAELRQMREDEPSTGNYLRAKDYPNGADVNVTGVEVRQNGANAKFNPGEFQPYWTVDVKGGPSGVLIRESKPMSQKLEALGIADPVGKTFMLTTQPTTTGGPTWVIARVL